MVLPPVRIEGADDFRRLARRVQRMDLSAAMHRGIKAAAPPTVREIQAEPLKRLPRHGGLAARVAKTRIATTTTTRGAGAGVRLTAQPNAVRDPGRIDRGRVAHLTFGHRPRVFQQVRRGWFTDPARASAPRFRASIEAELSKELRG